MNSNTNSNTNSSVQSFENVSGKAAEKFAEKPKEKCTDKSKEKCTTKKKCGPPKIEPAEKAEAIARQRLIDGIVAQEVPLALEIAIQQALEQQDSTRESFHISDKATHLKQFDIENETPKLFAIIKDESVAKCRALLDGGMDANTADDTGQSALMVAAMQNRLDMAKLLIEQGADVNQSSLSGLTALHYAALENHDSMARLLLEKGANVDAAMTYSSTDGNFGKLPLVWEYIGASPLLIAVESGHAETLAVLLDFNANPHHALTRNEYELNADRANYLDSGEVTGLDENFLDNSSLRKSDEQWTPQKQAVLLNDAKILAFFAN